MKMELNNPDQKSPTAYVDAVQKWLDTPPTTRPEIESLGYAVLANFDPQGTTGLRGTINGVEIVGDESSIGPIPWNTPEGSVIHHALTKTGYVGDPLNPEREHGFDETDGEARLKQLEDAIKTTIGNYAQLITPPVRTHDRVFLLVPDMQQYEGTNAYPSPKTEPFWAPRKTTREEDRPRTFIRDPENQAALTELIGLAERYSAETGHNA